MSTRGDDRKRDAAAEKSAKALNAALDRFGQARDAFKARKKNKKKPRRPERPPYWVEKG